MHNNNNDNNNSLTFLMEAFPTELTHEGFVPGVDPCVCVERGAAVEGFPALVTLVRFFLQKYTKIYIIITL